MLEPSTGLPSFLLVSSKDRSQTARLVHGKGILSRDGLLCNQSNPSTSLGGTQKTESFVVLESVQPWSIPSILSGPPGDASLTAQWGTPLLQHLCFLVANERGGGEREREREGGSVCVCNYIQSVNADSHYRNISTCSCQAKIRDVHLCC